MILFGSNFEFVRNDIQNSSRPMYLIPKYIGQPGNLCILSLDKWKWGGTAPWEPHRRVKDGK